MLVVGCASAHRPVSGSSAIPIAAVKAGWSEEGLASWYGEPYHGRKTASGSRYDMREMTAAHRTLPFGTLLRVTNRDSGRVATVLVNDRGPFVSGRILDLSQAAAEQLDAIGPGVIPVRIEVVKEGDGMPDAPCWEVQVGAFARDENVRRATDDLRSRSFATRTAPASGGLTRVRVTALAGRARAFEVAAALAGAYPGAVPVPCPSSGAGW